MQFVVVAVGLVCWILVDTSEWLMMMVAVVVVVYSTMTMGMNEMIMVCLYHCPLLVYDLVSPPLVVEMMVWFHWTFVCEPATLQR